MNIIKKLGLSFVMLAAAFCAQAVTETVNGITWTYSVSNGKAEIYSGSSRTPAIPSSTKGAITIPSTLGGYPVMSIGSYAFCKCSGLTSVTIPDSVTSIGEDAFYYCSGLTSVTIGNSVTNIGDGAFYNCSGLTSVTIPDGVTSIGRYAFSDCEDLASAKVPLALKEQVENEYVFEWCSNDLVVEYYCVATFDANGGKRYLTVGTPIGSLSAPTREGYEFLGWFTAVDGGTQVTEDIVVTGDMTLYAQWSEEVVLSAFEYVISNDCAVITKYIGTDTVVDIPSIIDGRPVTSIGNYAFYDCSSLAGITIPDSVTSIGDGAFSGCIGLASVTIPDSVTSIGVSAFYGCSSLTSVTIPDSVTSIGASAFGGCERLADGQGFVIIRDVLYYYCGDNDVVTIPDSVTSIGGWAFCDCDSLTSVTIGNSVTSIGDHVFQDCSSLTSVTIGNSVTSIGDYAFSWCESLTSVTIPDSVTSIGDGAFCWCSSLTSVTIPNSVTSIGDDAFYKCSGLMSVTIGNGVRSIGRYAFSSCSSLTSVTIPDSVTSIGDYAFSGCRGLTSVTIPDSVTSIGDYAFSSCSNLIYAKVPLALKEQVENGWVFASCSSKLQVEYYGNLPPASTEVTVDVGGGKSVVVSAAWIESYADIVAAAGGDKAAALQRTAANGRKVWECFMLGVDPTKDDDDFRITRFWMENGEPKFEFSHSADGAGNSFETRIKVKGKAKLSDGWSDVSDGGNPSFRFFTVEVALP